MSSQAFTDAASVLSRLEHPNSETVDAWLRMAAQTQGLVDAGRSHIPTLIRNDSRLFRSSQWNAKDSPGAPVRDILALAQASRQAGWAGADGEDILLAALERGDSSVLEGIRGLEGIPDPSAWAALQVVPVSLSGAAMYASQKMPAPCAWAALQGRWLHEPLLWWIARGVPLPERILDHACTATLDMLVKAGAHADAGTLAAWKARTAPRNDQPLTAADVAAMSGVLMQLLDKEPPGQAARPEAAAGDFQDMLQATTRSRGLALIESLGTHPMFNTAMASEIARWKQDSGAADWPLLYAPSRTGVMRGMRTPVPWWLLAITAPMKTEGQAFNLDALFQTWKDFAGDAPQFHPDTTPAERDSMLGMALLAAWAVAGATHNGNLRLSDYGRVRPASAAYASAQAHEVMAWAGLDEAAAGRCLGTALTRLAGAGNLGKVMGSRLEVAGRALMMWTFCRDAAIRPDGSTDCSALIGMLEAQRLPRAITEGWAGVMDGCLQGAFGKGCVSDSDKARLAGDTVAAAGEGPTVDNVVARLTGLLSSGVRPCPEGWPEPWRAPGRMQMVLAQMALADTPATPASRSKTRRLS